MKYTQHWLHTASNEDLLTLQRKITREHKSATFGKQGDADFTYPQLTNYMTQERGFAHGYYLPSKPSLSQSVWLTPSSQPLIRKTIMLSSETAKIYDEILKPYSCKGLITDYIFRDFLKKLSDKKIKFIMKL